jgi:AcrR family transcriptional regulator
MTAVKASRRDRSRATRRKILEAAYEEFVEKGYHGATIAAIAERARVAPQTVYFVFHNKPALISAVIDHAVLGDDSIAPPDSEWWAAAVDEADAAESLRVFIRGSGPLFARASVISETLRAASLTDDELRATYDRHERLRYDAFGEFIGTIAPKGGLREGLDEEAATDLLFTLFSDTVYYLMTVERHWSHERFVDWLCEALPHLLLRQD